MSNIKVSMGIARSSQDTYSFDIKDEASGQLIVKVEMTGEEFAQAITGWYQGGYDAKVGDLSVVGKLKVRESRSIYCPLITYTKEELTDWLKINCQEEGWILDPYLGSQQSVKYKNGEGCILNYSVFKYVNPEEN